MCICHYCGKQGHLRINFLNSEISIKCRNISTKLHIYNAVTNLSAANLSANSTCHLSPTVSTHLLATVLGNLPATTNSNTATELTSKWNSKTKTNTAKLEIVNSGLLTNFQFYSTTIRFLTMEFGYWFHQKSKFSTLFKSLEFNRQPVLTSNIPLATVTNDKTLAAIFSFELEKTTIVSLFSEVALKKKPIMVMYTDAKVDGHSIKLILDSCQVDCATSARIITANGATKTLIGEINDFSFEVNSIITSINILVMEATQYQALVGNDWLSKTNAILDWTTQKLQLSQNTMCGHFKTINSTTPLIKFEEEERKPTWEAYQKEKNDKEKKKETTTTNTTSFNSYTYFIPPQSIYCRPKLIYVNCDKKLSSMGTCCADDKEYAMKQGKWDNQPCLTCGKTLLDEGMWNNIPGDWVKKGTPIEAAWRRAVQQLNSCPHDDDEIWQMTLAKIEGTSLEEIKKIKNNSPEPIELDWDLEPYSDNNESIIPEHVQDTDAGFDLRYPEKEAIKLEPNSHTCIDLKIALEIPATTMVQLASKSSLVKKKINIRGGIIDAGYIRNIIVMLQNNSEKAYIIEPNEKIAQAIFLPLVKIAQLVGIQEFRSTGRIDILVNMIEEKVIDKEEIISTHQSISILPYDQYMLAIKKKVRDQAQLFETEAIICKSEEIGFTNLYILAKSPKNIKILIYNTTGSVIKIPKRTIIRYLTTKVEDQPPNYITDFLQLCGYVDITSQIIYGKSECYLLQPEQLEQINMGNLDPLQQIQFKMLLNNFNDIFASKNEFG
ncbi:hypothetical protein G9A89_012701 [Geosiphon pyriformis]|nr:hypothetical protein G9A89_012701 [Geosiphon pyriformis]